MSTYRYPGVKPFETSDRHIFFGRDQDIVDLYDLIVLEKLVVLFGKSGYGKSSLLNAGILPKFQTVLSDSDIHYQPITVRFNLYVDDNSIPPLEQVRRRLAEETTENPEGNFLNNDTLWQQFKRRSPSSTPTLPQGEGTRDALPPLGGGLGRGTEGLGRGYLLVFDQFEEFFSYPSAQQIQFKEELAELLYKTLPQAVRDALDDYTAEQRSYLSRKLDVKAVFAIRSDRMSDLDSLKDRLPAILYKRYELKGLSPEQARKAIIQPAALPNTDQETFLSPPFVYTPAALDKIIQELTAPTIKKMDGGDSLPLGEGRGGAEAFQLQILCQYIENEVINGRIRDRDGDGSPDVHADDLPDIANVYEAYYRSQLDKLKPTEREAARELIEYGLLYEDPQKGEARRLSVDADLLVQQFAAQGATRTLLTRLENTFLLRREMNTLGGYNYELSHDTLIAPVLKAKAEREADKERRAAERRAQEAEAQAREERKRSRRATIFAIVGFLLAAVAIGFGIWAFALNKKATAQRIEIEKNLKTLTEKEEALQLTLQEAKAAKDTAEVRRIEAELATIEAKRQTQIADLAKIEAQTNFRKATQAQADAEGARARAEQDYEQLQRVAAQTVALLLREADRHILQLDYDAAREKCQAAKSLGVQRLEVQKRVLEIAFFYNETGQDREAFTILRDLLGRGFTPSSIPDLDSAYYDTLLRRYYPDMVTVEGGTFTMGSDEEEDNPPHTVTLSSFSIAKTETTVWQYNLFAVATKRELEAPGWGLWGDNPIVNVSWYDAIAYANWLSERKELQAVYSGDLTNENIQANWQAKGYRLPTEAEWEFAARGGNLEKDKNYEYAGGNELDELGWFYENSKSRTQPVAQKKPNSLGLYDMSGNVYEWCWDWYSPLNPPKGDLPNTPSERTEGLQNPRGAVSGTSRVLRGGSWVNYDNYCRVAFRSGNYPYYRDNYIGFRVAQDQ